MKPGFLTQLMSAFTRPAPARPFAPPFEPAVTPRHDPPVGRVDPAAYRSRGRTAFTEDQKAAVWHKGQPIIGWDPAEWRVDHRGNPLFRLHYRDSTSAFGWEVGYILDPGSGGAGEIANLRPVRCARAAPEEPHLGRPFILHHEEH
jgi:hypothetical protein